MGCSFSKVIGNTIHDIHVRQLFTGAEMAGIKFHAAIDVEIRGNHIYRTCLGTWLDWMAQGAHVTGNLYHDNLSNDLFVEVDHGPFLVDNNLFLSRGMLLSLSQGGAYVHNLALGGLNLNEYDARLTPFHKAHSTELAGMHDNPRGDDRYYNNLFVERANLKAGNVFLKGAKPCKQEEDALQKPKFDPEIRLVEKADGIYLEGNFDTAWAKERTRKLVTTELLGKASIPNLPYENPDGSPLSVSTDYFGKKRNEANPFPGPFEISESGKQSLKIWPIGEGK
jgi:alpha-N-arabinofuranosidase